MMKVCINADDFGLHPAVNAGILDAVDAGVVSSVSVMPFHAAAPAVEHLVGRNPVSVGLHAAFTSGTSRVICRVSTPAAFCAAWMAGCITADGARRELEVQLAELRRFWRGPVSHVDVHEHLHAWPPLYRVLRAFARDAGIPSVRIPHDLSPHLTPKARVLRAAFPVGDVPFFGISLMGARFTAQAVKDQFAWLRSQGVSRAVWMVHVGRDAAAAEVPPRDYRRRPQELATLLGLQSFLHSQADIVPMSNL